MRDDPLNQCVPVLSELLSLQGLPTENQTRSGSKPDRPNRREETPPLTVLRELRHWLLEGDSEGGV